MCWGDLGGDRLVGHGGPGQKPASGEMAPRRDARAAGREPKRVGRARAIQRSTSHPHSRGDVSRRAPQCSGVFLCELVGKLFPEETAHPEVYTLFQTALMRVEEEEQVGWIHAEFMGQLIALMGLAPALQLRLGRMCWTCNRANGSTPWAPRKTTCRHRCPSGLLTSQEKRAVSSPLLF